MGVPLFSDADSSSNANNELESEKNQFLNYNHDAKSLHLDKFSPSESQSYQMRKQKCRCGAVTMFVSGIISLAIGLLSIKFTFTDIILDQKLKMAPWFPFYNTWLDSDIETRFNVYIFVVENADDFLNGTDFKLKLKEIGPIVYREYLQHRDVVRHDNSTLSYSSYRRAEFLPHANKPGILNETVTVLNFAVLAAASFVNDYNLMIQMGYNFLHRRHNNGLFINVTVYDYLWNYESELLKKIQSLGISIRSDLNSGIMYNYYAKFPERHNVKIGTKYGNEEFFHINTINGAPIIQGYNVRNGVCYASIANFTEGALYRQRVTKNNVLAYWAVCRAFDMHFAEELQVDGIPAFKFLVRPDIHDRKPTNETDCGGEAHRKLQNGISDASECYFGLPLASSQPHFYGRSDDFTKKLEGLEQSEEKHSSFIIVEPKLGVPIVQTIRTQINLVVPEYSCWFDKDYGSFSNMTVPLLWTEVIQKGLTPEITSIVKLFVNIVPIIEVVFICVTFIMGTLLILTAYVRKIHLNSKQSKQMRFQMIFPEVNATSNLLRK